MKPTQTQTYAHDELHITMTTKKGFLNFKGLKKESLDDHDHEIKIKKEQTILLPLEHDTLYSIP